MAYILRLPFRLPPGQELNTKVSNKKYNGLDFVLENDKSRPPALIVSSFESEDAARDFIDYLWAGLMWSMICKGISPEVSLHPQKITYTSDPIKAGKNLGFPDRAVDVVIDSASPAIYFGNKRISLISAGSVAILQGYNADQILDCVIDALGFCSPEKIISDSKLRVALDIYSTVYRETSLKAKFITLNMVLEVLAPKEYKHEAAVNLIKKWYEDIKYEKDLFSEGSEGWLALDSLKREVDFRSEVSIRKKIGSLVLNELSGEEDAHEVSRKAVKCYDNRSQLVHSGHLPSKVLSESYTSLSEIVKRVLMSRFVKSASAELGA